MLIKAQWGLVLAMMMIWGGGCRIWQGEVSLTTLKRNDGWFWLERMALNEGEFTVQLDMTATLVARGKDEDIQGKTLEIELMMIRDDEWQQAFDMKCSPSIRKLSSIAILPYTFTTNDNTPIHRVGTIQLHQPSGYSLVMTDCKHTLRHMPLRRGSKLNIHLHITNNGSEFDRNDAMMVWCWGLGFLMNSLAFWYLLKHQKQSQWVHLMVTITMGMEAAATGFSFVGCLLYLSTYEWYYSFDFLYLLLHSLSISMTMSILVLLGNGWTIINPSNQQPKPIQFDLYVPLCTVLVDILVSMMGIIQMLLTMLTKIPDTDGDKYHMYDTIPSYVEIILRLGLVGFFLYGWYCQWSPRPYTKKKRGYRSLAQDQEPITTSNLKLDHKLERFLPVLIFIALLYMLSLPLLLIFDNLAAISSRATSAIIFIQLVKRVVNYTLIYWVVNPNSMYISVTREGRSFMEMEDKLY